MPQVSVMLITYNSAGTLATAIGSVLAQEFADWELLIVDDGSCDDTEALVKLVTDPRVEYIRLSQNSGRGAARRAALEKAAGKYVAFVDADDWLYPDKLAFQVSFLDSHPEVGILSCSMAICSGDGKMHGVRRVCGGQPPVVFPSTGSPRKPILPFAPSMVRADLARRIGFDARFRLSEDAPFLTDCCIGAKSAFDGRIAYAYVEDEPTPGKAIRSAWTHCGFWLRRLPEFPLRSALQIARYCVAIVCAFALGVTPGWRKMVKRRSVTPTAAETERHQAVWSRIQKLAAQFDAEQRTGSRSALSHVVEMSELVSSSK